MLLSRSLFLWQFLWSTIGKVSEFPVERVRGEGGIERGGYRLWERLRKD